MRFRFPEPEMRKREYIRTRFLLWPKCCDKEWRVWEWATWEYTVHWHTHTPFLRTHGRSTWRATEYDTHMEDLVMPPCEECDGSGQIISPFHGHPTACQVCNGRGRTDNHSERTTHQIESPWLSPGVLFPALIVVIWACYAGIGWLNL